MAENIKEIELDNKMEALVSWKIYDADDQVLVGMQAGCYFRPSTNNRLTTKMQKMPASLDDDEEVEKKADEEKATNKQLAVSNFPETPAAIRSPQRGSSSSSRS
ncbi:hypothetical protein T02_6576 [Trichinella nativa]|uniref:Uncharacterized protein n=1 Tax=Trichinella nativa TaxID=6335 RepID=A0A0V1L0G1_9BILA|nr:hypothetical protein T02_6576 [Trichinella nativa]